MIIKENKNKKTPHDLAQYPSLPNAADPDTRGVLPDLLHGFPRQSPGRGTRRLHLPLNFLEPDGFFLPFQGAGEENQWQKPCVEASWVVEESRAKSRSASPPLCSPPQKSNT